MRATGYKHELTLKHPFKVSYGVRYHQPVLVVKLDYQDWSGYGEVPAIFYYNCDRDEWLRKIDMLNDGFLKNYAFETPEKFWEKIREVLKEDTFLLSAFDIAAWDLYGKIKGMPLYKLWNLDLNSMPKTSFTIGINTPDIMINKIKEEQWPIYKIKLGPEEPINMVKILRKHTNAVFRVDANCSWAAEQVIEYASDLKSLGVEFIEQPLPRDSLSDMAKILDLSALPIVADESCCTEEDIERCKGCFHGVNIKLAKCGGLTPALRMIHNAKNSGLKVMVGCMVEGTIGISAIAHLLPLLDYVDMDGSILIRKDTDTADGVIVEPSGTTILDKPGHGAIVRPEVLGNH